MKIEKIKGKTEKKVLVSLILRTKVISRISPKWKPGMFRSKWANVVAEMCMEYFKKYGRAPRKNLVGIVESWIQKHPDSESSNIIGKFLTGLSEEFESQELGNTPYLVDLAARHFNRVAVEKLQDRMLDLMDKNRLEEVQKEIKSFQFLEIGANTTVNVLHDEEALKRAFEDRKEPLFTLPGDIGKFFGRSLQREGFLSFMGPEKRGKTTWLVWIAWQAILQRKKVAFFSLGDESEQDMMIRFSCLASKRPMLRRKVKIPYAAYQDGEFGNAKHKIKRFKRRLNFGIAKESFKAVVAEKLRSKEEFLKLDTHPNDTLSMRDLEARLDEWEKEGFIPDVVCVDYLDIARDDLPREEKRHQINDTWKAGRRISQQRHILLITATQSNALSYDAVNLSKRHFSENKAKLAHVTGMIGLNQTEEEQARQVMRLNWIVRRGDRFSPLQMAICAGCLDLANPAMKTKYGRDLQSPD